MYLARTKLINLHLHLLLLLFYSMQDFWFSIRNVVGFQLKIMSLVKNAEGNEGALLLQRYQEQWQALHSTTVDCTKDAEKLSKQLQQSLKQVDVSNKKLTRLCSHLVLLQDINQEVEAITVAIGKLGASFEEVSSILAVYENVSDEYEAYKKLQHLNQEMHQFRVCKRLELDMVKANIAKNNPPTEPI